MNCLHNTNPKYFSTHDELADEIKKAIVPTYRAGVKKLLEKQKSLLREIEALKDANRLQETKGTSNDGLLPSPSGAIGFGLGMAPDGNALTRVLDRDGLRPGNSLGLLGMRSVPSKDEKK